MPEHKHAFDDLVEVRRYPASATVGIYQCRCEALFATPICDTCEQRVAACECD